MSGRSNYCKSLLTLCSTFNLKNNCHILTDVQLLIGNQYLSIGCSNQMIIIVVLSSS